MQPGFKLFLGLVASLTIAFSLASVLDGSASPLATHPASCHDAAEFQPVSIEVPMNGQVSFGVDSLIQASTSVNACFDVTALGASILSVRTTEGEMALSHANALQFSGDDATVEREAEQRFVFSPRSGFTGASRGWEFTIFTRENADRHTTRIGTVPVTFLIRNSLPQANDDAIKVAPVVGETVVPASLGVLSNDTDANGDHLVVYSDGELSFPWGTVAIRADGSYRVNVTDASVSGSDQARYVVWDTHGSTANADYGYLTVIFESPAAAPAANPDQHPAFPHDTVPTGAGAPS